MVLNSMWGLYLINVGAYILTTLETKRSVCGWEEEITNSLLDAMFLPFVDWISLEKHTTTIDEEKKDNEDTIHRLI